MRHSHQLHHFWNAKAHEDIGRVAQTSRVVQNFYRALESGELYSDDQWKRWQQVRRILPRRHNTTLHTALTTQVLRCKCSLFCPPGHRQMHDGA